MMKPDPGLLLPALLAICLSSTMPAFAQSANAKADDTKPDNASLDVPQLFATTCGWCHSDAGRAAG